MEVLTVIEHESVPLVARRSPGDRSLDEKQARALSRLEAILPEKTFSWGHQRIKFAQYCGVISLGNLTIEILPKIYGLEANPGTTRDALIRMLAKARCMNLQTGGMANVALQKRHLLDVFILHFCQQLHDQLMQGMIQQYVEWNENLNVIRGRLRVEQQFMRNLAHRERLFCQYDELSVDNRYNQVIKAVLRLLLPTTVSESARKAVTELLMRFDAVGDRLVAPTMVDSLSFDRSNNRYRPVFEQCRWFLQGMHPDVLAGDRNCITLLFDMNRLFESYVAAELRSVAWQQDLRLRVQGPQKYLMFRKDTGQQVFLLKPDISLLDGDNRVVLIADAKWKLLDEGDRKLGISQGDLYQMAGYASRYCVKNVALIFPRQRKLTRPVQLEFQAGDVNLVILPFDVTSSTSMQTFPLPGFSA